MSKATTTPSFRSVQHIESTQLMQPRPGFSTRSLRVSYEYLMDPFVNLDNFWMDRNVFPPHPHAGFSAITYMFPDSEGTFRNQWSKGPEQDLINPGAIHWTQAGSGMMHEEIPVTNGIACHGLQMFVKLPADRELSPPAAFHVDGKDVPEWTSSSDKEDPDVRVRVLVGSYGDVCATFVTGNDDIHYLDVYLKKGASIEIPATQTAFVFTIQGSVTAASADGSTTVVGPDAAAFFASDGNTVKLTAPLDGDNAQFLFCGGKPNQEPLIASGPFMMTSKERITEAMANFRSGAMGHIESLSK